MYYDTIYDVDITSKFAYIGADPFLTTVIGENALCMAIYYFLNNPMDTDFSCLEMLAETG